MKTILTSAVIGGLFALSTTTFQAEAGVLIQDWNGSDESGFGELAMGRNDDGSTGPIAFDSFPQLNFNSGLNFFGTTYNQAYINNNGNVSFNGPISTFTPDTFPLEPGFSEGSEEFEGPEEFPLSAQPMIAPFWGDVDTSCDDCGEVYIGSPNENTVVVTWNEVGFYNSDSSLTNTFQLVLIDREDTGAGNFDVEFRYEDINWTTGDASNGENGLGGTPAQAGYDAGDGVNFFVVPGSQTASVVDLDTSPSNTETAGIWKFSVRDGELPGDTAENPILPITDPNNPGDYSFEFAITDNDPIFIDPDVAIGYDYIVNSGPSLTSVLLPQDIGDNLFDLWLWDSINNQWYDTDTDIIGGVWFDFSQPIDEFRIMGIEIDELLDPTDPLAFVTGLKFDDLGIINMNQIAVTQFIPESSSSVPEPQTLLLLITAFGFLARKRFRLNQK